MLLEDFSEPRLIQVIKNICPEGPGIIIGIGDDAAVLALEPGSRIVATSDMLVEGIHFDRNFISAYQLGWKSLAVNLSDVAAMGGTPRFALVSLGLTENTELHFVEDFYYGFKRIGEQFTTYLCGGDTVKSPSGIIVSVTVLGSIEAGKILTRSGARPGDLVAVTGVLGSSAAGLALFQKGILGRFSPEVEEELKKAHLEPLPRVREGQILLARDIATAANDISDGLAVEVREIAAASEVGAIIYGNKIPISKATVTVARFLGEDPLQWALGGGEDYELVFTFPPEKMGVLKELKIPVTIIGEIKEKEFGVFVDIDGKMCNLEGYGYDHFKKKNQ
ncbi:MAG: Thiamine-monophosphate kinase [Thermoanaerobacterales bacterium 50_218]|nr:MAG: Thiamine-monophosphate kinase [Thermoanaerobacterales bacterium 50_218]HAA89917.1 thiamine-phosphate kinase [Peptococcaceae bacterium]